MRLWNLCNKFIHLISSLFIELTVRCCHSSGEVKNLRNKTAIEFVKVGATLRLRWITKIARTRTRTHTHTHANTRTLHRFNRAWGKEIDMAGRKKRAVRWSPSVGWEATPRAGEGTIHLNAAAFGTRHRLGIVQDSAATGVNGGKRVTTWGRYLEMRKNSHGQGFGSVRVLP